MLKQKKQHCVLAVIATVKGNILMFMRCLTVYVHVCEDVCLPILFLL